MLTLMKVGTIWLGNFLGRKKTIIVGSSIMIVGAAIQAGSMNLSMLIVSRLITGFGNGKIWITSDTVPSSYD
jgi:MFS family permease